jgi:uncharacterized membrane protein YcaP (DUF421 family)
MPEWLNVLLRAIALLIVVFTLVRLLGKKHPAKATPFRFVNYAVIAVITALLVLNATGLEAGLIALAVWFLLPLAGEHLALRSKKVHDLLYGRETVVIRQGKVLEENLRQARLTGDELLNEIRLKNVFSLADVEFAVLEPTGDLNVLLKAEKVPVTPYALEQPVSPRVEPQTVIMDGAILDDRLAGLGLNRRWLKEKLAGGGVTLDNVFIGQADSSGDLYLDLFDDSLQPPQPKVKELLYASLQKAQADLETCALEAGAPEAKELYGSCAGKLKELLGKLEPYLLR